MKPRTGGIWAFDFDGTLSHLVPDRNAAVIDPDCRDVLTELAADPGNVVAIISSRSLDDLKTRVTLKNVLLAGGSGLEWLTPDGERLGPNERTEARLETERRRLFPALTKVADIPGVEIEDKVWSVAAHFRRVAPEDRKSVNRALENLHSRHGVSLHYGPEVAEIQFLQEVSKEIAVKTLVTEFGRGLTGDRPLYAGDDQNDAQAMRWVLDQGGRVYIVGNRISVSGARVVPDPIGLAAALRRLKHSPTVSDHKTKEETNE